MLIYVYTLTFAIVKNGEGSTASTSRAKEALGKAGEGWKILYWFPKISCHIMNLEM